MEMYCYNDFFKTQITEMDEDKLAMGLLTPSIPHCLIQART